MTQTVLLVDLQIHGWAVKRRHHPPLSHPVLEFGQQEVMVELVDTFDVGEHLGDHFVREHATLAILRKNVEMEHLNIPRVQRNLSHD